MLRDDDDLAIARKEFDIFSYAVFFFNSPSGGVIIRKIAARCGITTLLVSIN